MTGFYPVFSKDFFTPAMKFHSKARKYIDTLGNNNPSLAGGVFFPKLTPMVLLQTAPTVFGARQLCFLKSTCMRYSYRNPVSQPNLPVYFRISIFRIAENSPALKV